MAEWSDELTEKLLQLNRLIIEEESLPTTLQRVAELACSTVRGCDNCGLTLDQGGHPATVAHTGAEALDLDHAQYVADRGPCLDSYRENMRVHLASISSGTGRWPEFSSEAARLGVRSSLSIPLSYDETPMGALNLYSRTEDAYDGEALSLAEVYSAQAAVAISNAVLYWKTVELTQNLQVALRSREVIGQAKGILMAQSKLTGDEAFGRLRAASQRRNQKLVDVAEHVVRTGELP
jgi:GAF domain-containing protein